MHLFFRLFLSFNLVSLLLIGISPSQAQESSRSPTCRDNSPRCLYSRQIDRLEQLSQGCRESHKVEESMTYQVCRRNNQIVKASESLTEFGDGLGFWFDKGQVVAVERFHDGSLMVFNRGRLTEMYLDGGSEVQKRFSTRERRELENLAKNGFQDIFKKLNIR